MLSAQLIDWCFEIDELLPLHVIRHRLTHTLQLGRTKGLAAEAALGDRSPNYRVKAAGWAGSIVPIATRYGKPGNQTMHD